MATATANASNTSHLKQPGDKFSNYEQVVEKYQARGVTRAKAFRQATIDYPELHEEWLAVKGEAHTKMLAEKAKRR